VDFVTTGRSPSTLVVQNANGQAPWEQPAAGERPGSPRQESMDLSAPSRLSEGVAETAGPRTSGLRVASYATLGVGMAALGGAGVVRFLAQKDVDALEKRLVNGRILSSDTEALRLRSSLAQKGNLLTGLLVGGGAAVTTGAVLFWLSSPPTAPVSVGLSADEEGASASLSGTF
jgi:hypothetical protein